MMSADTVRALEKDLRQAFPPPCDVAVTPDPYAGARVRIIADEFLGMTQADRRARVLSHVADDDIAHLQLLTQAEADFLDIAQQPDQPAIEELPLWPEALAHGEASARSGKAGAVVVHSPSLESAALPPPVFVTFYSLRGGVGRSTALAHSARLLAGQGLRVPCVDLDLEAPGLASLFAVEDQVAPGGGAVQLLLRGELTGEPPDLEGELLQISDELNLQLIPAGLPSADYARRLALLDPAAWYREDVNPLRLLLKSIRALPRPPHVVLIDSRTGVSPLAAPLLFEVADLAIVAFYPHPQARRGTETLTRALLSARSWRSAANAPVTPEVRFLVSPTPPAAEVRELYAERAESWVAEWLAQAYTPTGERAYPDVTELVQVVSYQEVIASADSVWTTEPISDFETVAAWIAGLVEPEGADLAVGESATEPSKQQVLDTLRFTGETAEQQSDEDLRQTFLATAAVARALRAETVLVLGRKGTGKTAIFRRLAAGSSAIVVTSPAGTDSHRAWSPDVELFASLHLEVRRTGRTWRQVWPMILGVVLTRQGVATSPDWLEGSLLASSKPERGYRRSDLLRDVKALWEVPDAPLLSVEWLELIDQSLAGERVVLFDALETGFGSTKEERERRSESISGLLAVIAELTRRFRKLKFKVMLREDIWRDTSFPNKSHLAAVSARLSWADKTDYLRVALKQAWTSEQFRELISRRLGREDFDPTQTSIDYWPESFVSQAWVILAGERVSGGRTAFTDNWIWARLADANGDHSLRHLVQLLAAAVERERGFDAGNPYSRSILRPRALIKSLDDVSERALDALVRDEFPELEQVLDALREIGRTPFDADSEAMSRQPSELVLLAREVGLLESATDPRTGSARYRVPELYRKALQMNRPGQA